MGSPRGWCRPGESVTDAVAREVKEETGLDISVTDLVGVYTNPHHVMAYTDGEVRQQFSLCFRTLLTGGTIATSNETSEVRFVPVDDLGVLNIHPSMRLRIEHGLDTTRARPYVG